MILPICQSDVLLLHTTNLLAILGLPRKIPRCLVGKAKQLGDVVFVELPEIGREMDKGDEAAVVESVKAASEVYAPIAGEVTEVNEALEDAPETVNTSAEGEGWFLKIKISDASELDALMDEAKYKEYCESL